MLTSSWRSMIAAAGVVSLSILAPSSYAADLTKDDEIAIRGDIVDPNGGMIYRTPWIKSKEGQATLASLKPGDGVVCVFTQRTAFDVTPVN